MSEKQAYSNQYAPQPTGNPPPAYPQANYPPSGGPPPPVQAQPVNQVHVMAQGSLPLNQAPAVCNCPHCHASITTSVQYSSGTLTWIVAGVICLFGMWLGCCLIPFCINDCKDVTHICPNCGKIVGVFKRIS